jgi:hypothetical protein
MAGKDGGVGRRIDLVSMRQELDLLTRIISETSGEGGKSLPEARFAALVGMHIQGAREAIPLPADETERRIRELVDEEIANAFREETAS